jgi:hypothetical protein
VPARQGRARDVLDVSFEAQLIEILAAGELVPPSVTADFATMTLSVREYLERPQAA